MKYIVLDTYIYICITRMLSRLIGRQLLQMEKTLRLLSLKSNRGNRQSQKQKFIKKQNSPKKAKAISAKFGNYFLGIGSVPTVVFTNIATPLNGEFDDAI